VATLAVARHEVQERHFHDNSQTLSTTRLGVYEIAFSAIIVVCQRR
jgi:hypothetical protein